MVSAGKAVLTTISIDYQVVSAVVKASGALLTPHNTLVIVSPLQHTAYKQQEKKQLELTEEHWICLLITL